MEEKDRQRLLSLVAMFDAPFEGERVAAVAAANRVLERNGLTWRDYTSGLLGGAAPQAPPPPPPPPPRQPRHDWNDVSENGAIGDAECEDLMEWLESLVKRNSKISAWEAGFCNDTYERLEKYGGKTRVSEKQWDVINRIKKKIGDV